MFQSSRRDFFLKLSRLIGLALFSRASLAEGISTSSAAPTQVAPDDFRSPGDTDREVLQKLANALGNGVSAQIEGNFTIDRQIEIIGKSNFRIFGGGTITIADRTPIDYGHSALYFASCSDFSIEDLNCDGNRSNRRPGEAAGHLVVIDACHRWRMTRVRADNGTTDGFLIHTSAGQGTGAERTVTLADMPSDWIMEDCHANNNCRQGLSIIESLNWTISGGSFSGTNGLWDLPGSSGPCAGVDLEPDHNPAYPHDRLRFGRIEAVTFEGNQGAGLLISSVDGVSNIVVDKCRFLNNRKSAIECVARDIQIIAPEIRGWDSGPYTARHDTPPKRGLIDLGVSAGPDIVIREPYFADIRTSADSELPLIYVHGGAREGIEIRGLKTDGSAKVIAHLLAPGMTFADADVQLGMPSKFPAFFAAGAGVRFMKNRIRNLVGVAVECTSKQPLFIENSFEIRQRGAHVPVLDCSQAEGGRFERNAVRHLSPARGTDFDFPRGATVIDNTSQNNLGKDWLVAPSPRVMKGNHRN